MTATGLRRVSLAAGPSPRAARPKWPRPPSGKGLRQAVDLPQRRGAEPRQPAFVIRQTGNTVRGIDMANESTAKQSRTAAEMESLEEQIETLKSDISAISTTLADLVKTGVREGRQKAERTAEYYKQQG